MLVRLISFSVIGVLTIAPIILISNFSTFFYWQFERYDVYSSFKANEAEAAENFLDIINTLHPPFSFDLKPEFFSNEDILHMRDVSRIMQGIYFLEAILLGMSIGLMILRKLLSKLPWLVLFANQATEAKRGFKVLIIGMIAITIVFAWKWQESFIFFHQLLFPFNNYWQLDPITSNLIKFLPGEIFQELGILYLLLVASEYLILVILNRYLYGRLQPTPNSFSS